MPYSVADRRSSLGVAVAFAVLEIVMVPWLDEPVAAIVFAVLFLAAAAWIRHGGRGGLIMLAVLCGLELAFLPFYARAAFEDWLFQGAALILSVLGLATSIAALRGRSGTHISA